MSCFDTLQAYGLRSIGIGERVLPRSDITLCDQFVLIGSGMIWNIYYGLIAVVFGFVFANALAVAKNSSNRPLRGLANGFIFVFRGSPLFIQFFFAYFFFLSLKGVSDVFAPFSSAWLGALIILFLNTSAYSAEIFYGALRSIPKGEMEAADAYGLAGWTRFRRVMWPTMMRLAWPSYTNEAIFLFHSTALIFLSGFPARQQRGDALYYASYFADKTYNPFVPYPILALYFILLTMVIIFTFGRVNKRLNRHQPHNTPQSRRPKFMLIR